MATPNPHTWAALSAARRSRLSAGLPLLREAYDDAQAARRDDWEFAVTLSGLLAAGLTETDLRWLIDHGLIGHAAERAPGANRRRAFRPVADLALSRASCFVLTPEGAHFLESQPPAGRFGPALALQTDAESEIPRWDAGRRELTWRGELVKRFRTPAPCQELILAAFEEEGWPPRIDDPLSPGAGVEPRERLHESVRGLNRPRRSRLRFWRDGTGQGVCWSD